MGENTSPSPRPAVYSRAVVSPLWVARLEVSQKTAEKLASRHDLNWQDVRDAIVCVRDLQYAWDDNPERGLRALIQVTYEARRASSSSIRWMIRSATSTPWEVPTPNDTFT